MTRLTHLGLGNFHRAHQAWYTAQAGGWQITGVSLRSPRMRDLLAPQGFDYTLAIRDAGAERLERVTVITDILFAPEQPEAVLHALATCDVITLTITEKGYCLGSDGRLNLDHPDIKSDLAGNQKTALWYLVHGLVRRSSPATVISCDNLSHNGDTLRQAVETYAGAAGLNLPKGLAFPNTMVDRITPATTDALRDHVAAKGLPCAAPVATERFSEWVIEDRFAGQRPTWEKAGAQIVADARPYELRKLRMLNGAHSALAYAGLLAGHDYVHEAVADPKLRALVEGVFDEAAATLRAIETQDYRAALLERFANPSLNHSLRQIAMDGSQKLPVRLLSTINEHPARADACHKSVAAWMEFVLQETKAGRALDDPNSALLAQACASPNPGDALGRLIGYRG